MRRMASAPDFSALLLGLAGELGITRPHAWGDGVGETLRLIGLRLPPRENLSFTLTDSRRTGERRSVAPAAMRRLAPWICRDAPAAWFPEGGTVAAAPELHVVRLPGGYVAQIGPAPIVVAGDARTVVQDAGSRYAPLLHYARFDLAAVLAGAREVVGPVFLLGDDVWPPNYSHWLLDTLPRLAALAMSGWGAGAVLATSRLLAPYQRETLRLCGWDESRIVQLAPMQALQAEVLLASTDQPQPPHPLFKAAPWAARWLRQHLAPPAGGRADPVGGRRFYMSRRDAAGRRVLNEAALTQALAARGFETVSLGGLGVREQAALFDSAAWIVAPHGAALANIVFARPGATLLELFPRSYGTPAYYMLAAAGQVRYGCHIGPETAVAWREERPLDDFTVDVEALLGRYADLLPD
jgi:hypothetical protein